MHLLVSQTINITIRHCVVGHHIGLHTFKTALTLLTFSVISVGTLVLSGSEPRKSGRAVCFHPVDQTFGRLRVDLYSGCVRRDAGQTVPAKLLQHQPGVWINCDVECASFRLLSGTYSMRRSRSLSCNFNMAMHKTSLSCRSPRLASLSSVCCPGPRSRRSQPRGSQNGVLDD